jgi:ubiquinone biosynthesis protein
MCLEFGFFHADPHPGNIFVAPDGSVTFIDCGMTGSIDNRSRQELADLVRSVVQGDLDRAVRSAVRVTDADPALEYDRAFRTDTWELITRFKSDQIGQIDVPGLLNSLFELFRRHHVRCPSDLVYLIKALSTVHGVAKQFAPEFEVVSHLRPHIEKLLKDQYSNINTRDRLIQTLLNYVELAEDLPNEMRAIAAQIRRRDFSVRLEHKGLENLNDTIDRAARYLSVSFMMGAVVIGSAVLIHAEKDKPGFSFVSVVGILSYLIAGAFGLVLLLGAVLGKHGKKD